MPWYGCYWWARNSGWQNPWHIYRSHGSQHWTWWRDIFWFRNTFDETDHCRSQKNQLQFWWIHGKTHLAICHHLPSWELEEGEEEALNSEEEEAAAEEEEEARGAQARYPTRTRIFRTKNESGKKKKKKKKKKKSRRNGVVGPVFFSCFFGYVRTHGGRIVYATNSYRWVSRASTSVREKCRLPRNLSKTVSSSLACWIWWFYSRYSQQEMECRRSEKSAREKRELLFFHAFLSSWLTSCVSPSREGSLLF